MKIIDGKPEYKGALVSVCLAMAIHCFCFSPKCLNIANDKILDKSRVIVLAEDQ